MNANRAKKVAEVEELKARVEGSGLIVITHYSGLSVAKVTDLRARLQAEGASFKVTKNTLMRRALEGTPYANLTSMFTGPTAIATSADPIAAARIVQKFAKDNDKLVILGGAMGDVILDAAAVANLANLPSLDELRSKIVGLLQAPATKLARIAQAPASQLACVTKAYADKG